MDRLARDRLVTVRTVEDPVLDTLGHPARGDYVEEFWLPVLGPTATWLVRLLVGDLERRPAGFVADLGDVADRLGVSWSASGPSTLSRALARCEMFGACSISGSPVVVGVRRMLAPLPRRHLARLPDTVQIRHAEWLDRHRRPDTGVSERSP